MTSSMRHVRRSYRPIHAQNLSTDGVRRLLGSYQKSANGAIVDDFKLQPGFLYTQVRAISARINQNYDGWPSTELKKYYRTFLGKPVFVNHQNFDPTKARGRVVAARYVENGRDKYIEVIQEIDAQRFPKLANEIRTGGLDSVSMGVEAGFTKCSVCDNKATDMHDMCSHVKYHKGSYLPHAKTGKRTLVYENCYKLGFFELSYVFDPADETAVVSKVLVANKQKRTARRRIFATIGLPGQSPEHPAGTPPEHYVTPYKGRGYSGETVEAYRNLHSKNRKQGLWSLRAKNGPHAGRVIGHSDSVHMPNGEFFVNRAGADRVENSQIKEVHAGSRGTLGPIPHEFPSAPSGVTYNPKAGDKFFWHRNEAGIPKEQRMPVGATEHIHLAPDGRAYAFDSNHFGRGISPEVAVHHNPEKDPEPFYVEGGGIHPRYQQIGRDAMRHYAYGEIEAPEDVDTLRNGDDEDDTFHHYVESPKELRTPNMDRTINKDRQQEEDGLDSKRRAEAVEELNPADGGKKIVEPDVAHEQVVNDFLDWCDSIDVDPGQDSLDDFSNAYHLNNEDYQAISDFLESEGNGAGPTTNAQPVPRTSRRKMATHRFAEDYQGGYPEDPSMMEDPSMGGGDPMEELAQLPPEVLQQLVESGELPPELVDQLMGGMGGEDPYGASDFDDDEDYEGFDPDNDGDDDSDAEGDWDEDYAGEDEDEYADEDGDGDHDDDDHHMEDEDDEDYEGDNTGPVVDVEPDGEVEVHEARRRRANNGKSRTSSQKKRGTQKGKSMARETLASRGRKAASRQRLHRFADDSGHFDSGPYGEENQGEQEEVFISQTPGSEGLAAPVPGDGTISNTENTLVARINAKKESLQRDLLAYTNIQRMKSAGAHEFGDPSIIDPVNPYTGMSESATPAGSFGPTNGGTPQHSASRYAADGGIPDADTVNPELSGTDDQSLRGDDFERVQPDKVETQSKDASLRAFAAFDQWLRNTTGRTASQHGNANFIRRQAARWAGSNGYPVEVLFPALGNFLRQARRIEGSTNMRRTADEKLEVAAPQDRIDVEAPVSNVTDADAQASQFDLSDFGGNASDNVADPDLDTDSQIWAPGEGVKESNRKADGVAAIRLAEAYIRAGLKPEGEKYNLVAQFQTMRHATVTDRTRLLEAVLKTAAYNRRVTAGTNRGSAPRTPFPPGLMNGGGMSRSASVKRTAANDPSTDSDLFL